MHLSTSVAQWWSTILLKVVGSNPTRGGSFEIKLPGIRFVFFALSFPRYCFIMHRGIYIYTQGRHRKKLKYPEQDLNVESLMLTHYKPPRPLTRPGANPGNAKSDSHMWCVRCCNANRAEHVHVYCVYIHVHVVHVHMYM